MKILRYFLILLIVAAQVAYLVHSYGERTKEIENAPHLVLKCKQYDPRDIFRGNYFAISNSFLRLELDSPVWGKSLYWGNDFGEELLPNRIYHNECKAILDITPREKGADDAVDLNTLIDGGTLAIFWKQGEDGIHAATRVEAPGTAEDAAAEGEIRTVMNVEFDEFVPQRVETDEEGKDAESEADGGDGENKEIHYTVTATFKFSGITHYDDLHFYIPDNMTPNDYEIPEDWKDKFSVVLVYREDGTVIPNNLCVDGQPYLDAVKSLPRKEGQSRYNTSLYHNPNGGEVVPVVVPDKEEAAGEEKAEQTEQPSEEVKPEEPQPEVQPQPAEQPQTVEEPQSAEQPQQPAEEVQQPQPEPQQPAEEVQQPQPEPQPQAQEEPAPAPTPEAPAPTGEEDGQI